MSIDLLPLQNTPILKQLQIEEALLRTSDKNYCLINTGAPPSVVMGISAQIPTVVETDKLIKEKVPLIRRYSGGGTVVVDPNTIFISFIFQKDLLNLPLFPEPLMRWSADFYQKALQIPDFALKENDYVIKDKKCGGNAQYIQKNRFVHHTTFLWDFSSKNMQLLKMPPKVPSYRDNRHHEDFLCTLQEHITKESFINSVKAALGKEFNVNLIEEKDLKLHLPHRKTTRVIEEY